MPRFLTRLISFAGLLLFLTTGCSIERFLNKSEIRPPYEMSPEAQALHDTLWVADLHSDSLLWDRRLHRKRQFGHVDLPRALEGGVDFFVASTVSKTPWGLNMEENEGDSDMLVMHTMLQLWPPNTWRNIYKRVLYQGKKLERFERKSDGRLRIVRSQADMQQLLADQQTGDVVGTMLSTEGGQVLQGDLEKLDSLYAAGFRMLGLVHFFDNRLGGSAHGVEKGGITDFGQQVVARMEELQMIVDLSHTSAPLFADAISMATRPVVVSHTGIKGTCPGPRNLSDAQLDMVKQNGGIVGIGFFVPAICELSYAEAARTIRYVADHIGVQHVVLGSDWDGAVAAPTDMRGIGLLTEALMLEGFNEEEIAAIMGETMKKFFLENLPPE